MIELSVDLSDLHLDYDLIDKKIEFGGSKIEAFCSPHLLAHLSRHSGCDIFWVGEDNGPSHCSREQTPPIEIYRDFADSEGVAIFLRPNSREIEIVRTAAGSCPIYISANERLLVASWKFDDVALALPQRRANVDACRILLEHGHCQVRDMVLSGMFMLWPGESLKFGEQGLDFREIDEPDVVLSGSLRDDASVTEQWLKIIEHVVRPRIERSEGAMIELSGGLDSSIVAIASARVRRPLNSYALVHTGAMGTQQRNRRAEIVSQLGLADATHPSEEPGPFAALQCDEMSLTPFDDIYRMACVRGVMSHPASHIDLLISGIGGDELAAEDTFYRRDWELRGHSALSTITAAACRCDMFMRLGIWVSNPLAHPAVVNFCRALPEKMRNNRVMHLLTLARAGLSDGFLFPRYQEHYGNLIQWEASQYDFERALSGSIVAQLGIKDYGPLLASAYDAGYGGFSYSLISQLFTYLKLDGVLRRYVT